MKRSLKLFVYDIAESIKDIKSFLKGVSKKYFFKDKLRQNAVIRGLEIIGESTKNIPDSFREKYPEVQWRRIAGLRDIIIHAYFEIDLDTTWEIINKDLPLLEKQINEIKKNLD